jgi:hypothetical protein
MREYVGEICTVVTIMGEIVGRVKKIDDFVTIENPRLFVHTSEGMGFAPGICVSGEQDVSKLDINMSTVVTICQTNEDVTKGWIQQTSGILI